MSGTRYSVYEIQLQDLHNGTTIVGSGGKAVITTAGDAARATLYNADTFASLSQPISPTNGKFRFATLATVTSVDIYGMAAGGQCFVRKGIAPGAPTEIFLEGNRAEQELVIPWAAAEVTATTEFDTGFDLPTKALVMPWVSIEVSTIDATETIDVGLLSSESGGDANGFLAAASVGTAGLVRGTLVGTDTLGALLSEDSGGSGPLVPAAYVVGATAVSVTLTTSAGSDTGEGFIRIPYRRSLASA